MKTVAIVSRCSWTLYKFRLPLMEYMQKQGYRVIAVANDDPEFTQKIKDAGFEYFPVIISASSMSPFADLKLIFDLKRLYQAEHVDIVQHFTIKPVIYGSMAARLAGICNIVTITGLGHVFVTGKWWLRMIVLMLYRLALSKAQYVFFQNPDDQQFFRANKLVRVKQTGLIKGSGVDTDILKPDMQAGHTSLHFLMVSRLTREKGIGEFISAAKSIKQKYPEVRFSVVGDIDPYNPTSISADEIRQCHDAGILNWHGYQDDVQQYIHQSQVVVLPSYREGTPKTLLEAAACGKAIIATDVPGCREVVRHKVNGLLVAAKDAKALATAMEYMITHQEHLEAMGKAGRLRMETEFAQDIIFRQTLETYQQVCRET